MHWTNLAGIERFGAQSRPEWKPVVERVQPQAVLACAWLRLAAVTFDVMEIGVQGLVLSGTSGLKMDIECAEIFLATCKRRCSSALNDFSGGCNEFIQQSPLLATE